VMNVSLTLKEQDISNGVLEDSQNLEELPSKALIAVLVPVVLCRGLAQHGGRGGCWNAYTCNSCERILLSPDSKCTLISVTNEDSSSSCVDIQTVKWDVLLGSYKVKDGVALCSWEKHLCRSFVDGYGMFELGEKSSDTPWSFNHPSSSFKWGRIVLPDSPEERVRASLLERLPADGDLLMEDAFAEHIDESDLRHFKCWHNADNGVPAQLLKDVCEQQREHKQIISQALIKADILQAYHEYREHITDRTVSIALPHNACTVAIANDQLPIALAKEAVQWWRLGDTAERDALEKLHGDLLGWDVENGFILGVSITVKLAGNQEQYDECKDECVDGKMNELLVLMERGDQCQLPALGEPTMTMVQVPSNGFEQSHPNRIWKPVTYSKVDSIAATLSHTAKWIQRSELNLKVKLISFGNLSMIGDETGAVCMKVHSRTMFQLLKKLKVGASIIIRKATIRLRGGFGQPLCIKVDVDKDVGSIEESGYPFEFEPYQDNNISFVRCGDAVQVLFDKYPDIALTRGMKGVIAEINQHGDALVWFPGEEKLLLVKTRALGQLTFLQDTYGRSRRFDVSLLRDREIRRPGWFLEDLALIELLPGLPGHFVCLVCLKSPCKEGCVAGCRKGK